MPAVLKRLFFYDTSQVILTGFDIFRSRGIVRAPEAIFKGVGCPVNWFSIELPNDERIATQQLLNRITKAGKKFLLFIIAFLLQ